MFGISLLALLKTELLKYKDKGGTPVAIDALTAFEKSIVSVNNFVSKLLPADVQAILALLPVSVSAKFTSAELLAFSNAVANLPTELQSVEALITKLITQLEAK